MRNVGQLDRTHMPNYNLLRWLLFDSVGEVRSSEIVALPLLRV